MIAKAVSEWKVRYTTEGRNTLGFFRCVVASAEYIIEYEIDIA